MTARARVCMCSCARVFVRACACVTNGSLQNQTRLQKSSPIGHRRLGTVHNSQIGLRLCNVVTRMSDFPSRTVWIVTVPRSPRATRAAAAG